MGDFIFKSKARIAISSKCNLKCKYCDNGRVMTGQRVKAMEDFRQTSTSAGNITTHDYLLILNSLCKNGYDRVDFTGGEPMLNPDWDKLVVESKKMNFKSVEMTTNGTLLNNYIDQNGKFPEELDKLIISLDTYDSNIYQEIVGNSVKLDYILSGVKRLKKCNPELKLTANCVLCKSNELSIIKYIDFVKDIGFDSVTFLDLIVRDKRQKDEIGFFLKEFFPGKEVKNILRNTYGDLCVKTGRHAYNVTLPNGLNVSVVDTQGLTRRDKSCESCKYFCQEGFYTIKVATDGTITDCLGCGGTVINFPQSVSDGTLDKKIQAVFKRLVNGKEGYFFDKFYSTLIGQ